MAKPLIITEEFKRMQKLAGIIKENEDNYSKITSDSQNIEKAKNSITKVKEWVNKMWQENDSLKSTKENGTEQINILDKLDYIIYKTSNTIIKSPKSQIDVFRIIKRENDQNPSIYGGGNDPRFHGTIALAHFYKLQDAERLGNGILALSYNGHLIGDEFNTKQNTDYLQPDDIEDIEYSLYGEGPTFTSSQGGGHPFFDWDKDEMLRGGEINDHKFINKNGILNMITEFDPYEYVDKDLFDKYWKLKSKGNKIINDYEDDDDLNLKVEIALKGGKYYMISKIPVDKL
jgi:hypothetical protein